MRVSAVRALDLAGLGGIARKAKASGLWYWKPLVPRNEFLECCSNAIDALRAHEKNPDFGDYLEFGVSRGTSMSCMYHALQSKQLAHARLFGFDSFEGLPPEAAQEGWKPGAFKSTLTATQRYLEREGVDLSKVTLTKGWFKETLTAETRRRLGLAKASVIMIDCDIETASLDALRFAQPHIRDRAAVLLDDWDSDARGGQRLAFDQFLKENSDISARPLPSYTPAARVFMLTRSAIVGLLAKFCCGETSEIMVAVAMTA
jgi:hypothetical protein